MITYDRLKNNKTVNTYIESADATMAAMGYTDHGYAHVMKAAETAAMILTGSGTTNAPSNSRASPGTCTISGTSSTA